MRLVLAAVLCLTPLPAMADELPRGLGHPKDGSHWYDRQCCDNRDCEEVEAGAIVRMPNGIKIKFRSSRGHVAEGFIPWGASGLRASQDGREHVCSYNNGATPCAYLPAEM